MPPSKNVFIVIVSLAIVYTAVGLAGTPEASLSGRVSFNRQVRPILSDKCFACHGPDAAHRQADLRLDWGEGENGLRGILAVVKPGDPENSELRRRIRCEDEAERMPPPDSGKQLTESEIVVLEEWIRQGAVYEGHWAYQTPKRHPLPEVSDLPWCREPWDCFLMARWDEERMPHAAEADRRTLVRRLYFDLLGLPPASEEVEAFLADTHPDAYERLVDRLLASPHFGERMAVYWLDLVRYADTVGYHGDQEHAASPYRDYVIESFNEDKPFDQFTREQLAGDLLPDRTEEQWIASCYNRILQTSHEGGVQVKEYLAKYLADRVRNLGSVWLGSTLACAECHNHKYDPFSQQDFYSLGAFFADVEDLQTFRGGDTSPTKREPEIEVLDAVVRSELSEIENQLSTMVGQLNGSESFSDAQRAELLRQQQELEKRRDALRKTARRVMVTVSVPPRVIRVLPRGDWMDESGPVVQPSFPAFLKTSFDRQPRTRLDLAEWLTTPDHPLTARVFVNRIWALFFGEGLCPSLDDVGAQGQWPTYPELLDRLAIQFVEDGWDVKLLVRRIVLSAAYRQQSIATAEVRERDPGNLYFARQTARRLPAEFIRDAALAVSGLLHRRLGGPPARPYQPEGYYALLNFPKRTYQADRDANQYRRGVYMHWQRQFLHPMLKAFDAPQREECVARRPVSNTPLAALVLLNDPTFVEAARVFAERILRDGGNSIEERIQWAWSEALSRPPTEEERLIAEELFQENLERYGRQPDLAHRLIRIGLAPPATDLEIRELAAWTQVARAIFNLSEFVQRN